LGRHRQNMMGENYFHTLTSESKNLRRMIS